MMKETEPLIEQLKRLVAEDREKLEKEYRGDPFSFLYGCLFVAKGAFEHGDEESFKCYMETVLSLPFLDPNQVENWLAGLHERSDKQSPVVAEIWAEIQADK